MFWLCTAANKLPQNVIDSLKQQPFYYLLMILQLEESLVGQLISALPINWHKQLMCLDSQFLLSAWFSSAYLLYVASLVVSG